MASRSAFINNAGTTAQDVVLNGPGAGFDVANLDGAGYIAIRYDGTAADDADNNFFVPKAAGAHKTFSCEKWPVTISVWASATTVVSLEVIDG